MANKYRKTYMNAAILSLIFLLGSTIADFTTECQRPCDCTWQSGNKAAICSNLSLTIVPAYLSKQIQILDLSNNPLQQLNQEVFKRVGLINLKKLLLRECYLKTIHKEAFSSLSIMIELDLSKNLIRYLHPDTFTETEKIRLINLNNNHLDNLEDETFRNLKYLQKVELSNNIIFRIGDKAFTNLPQLKIIRLDGNRLNHMKLETLSALRNLSGLDLHNNPWRCDCNLQSFRDWVVSHNLYTPPTSCYEPALIHDKLWNELHSSKFACRPTILESFPDSTIKSYYDNVTLTCKVVGSPPPDVSWRFNGKILKIRSFGEIHYSMAENTMDLIRWVNLTIVHTRYYDGGNYTCVAENYGGRDEKTIVLMIIKSYGFGTIAGIDMDCFSIIVGCLTAIVIMLGVILAVCLFGTKTSYSTALIDRSITSQTENEVKNKVKALNKLPRKYNKLSFNINEANEMLKVTNNLIEKDSVSAFIGECYYQRYGMEMSKISKEMLLDKLSRKHLTYLPDLLTFPHSNGNQMLFRRTCFLQENSIIIENQTESSMKSLSSQKDISSHTHPGPTLLFNQQQYSTQDTDGT